MTGRRAVAALFAALVTVSCAGAANEPATESTSSSPAATFDPDRTDLDPGPPPTSVDQALLDTVAQSAVRFSGEGCKRPNVGSGFIVAQDLVATNAHVVAGVAELEMTFYVDGGADSPDATVVSGTVVGFDTSSDIALVAVPTGDRDILPLADGALDEEGFVLGFGGSDESGDLDPDPFRVNRRITATGEDIYQQEGENRRPAYLLAAEIEPGDSGGAVVRADGVVIGMAFASSNRGAYAVRAEVLEAQLAEPTIMGDPLRCLDE